MRTLTLFLAAFAAFAAEPADKPKTEQAKPAPALAEAAKTAYWRARALAGEARQVAEKAIAEQARQEQALASACGSDAAPQLDGAGELSCTPKPKPADPPK